MCNADVLIEKMLEDERTRNIILVSLMSSDNESETLNQRLETSKTLRAKVEENKQIAESENNDGTVEKLNDLISKLDTCISIIERDIAEMEE